MPSTNQKFSVHPLEVSDLGATVLTGQEATAELASFALGPRTIVGAKVATWRQHPNTVNGRKLKVR